MPGAPGPRGKTPARFGVVLLMLSLSAASLLAYHTSPAGYAAWRHVFHASSGAQAHVHAATLHGFGAPLGQGVVVGAALSYITGFPLAACCACACACSLASVLATTCFIAYSIGRNGAPTYAESVRRAARAVAAAAWGGLGSVALAALAVWDVRRRLAARAS